MLRSDRRIFIAALLPALLAGQAISAGTGRFLAAEEVTLKNGMVLRGVPTNLESLIVRKRKQDPEAIVNYPIVMVSSRVKTYFVPARQVESVNKDVNLARREGFKLPQRKEKGSGRMIEAVHGFVEKPGPFDEFGRRTVTLQTA